MNKKGTNSKKSPTFKEKKFAKEYVKRGNATQAYIEVYDAKTKNKNTLSNMAHETVTKPHVIKEIDRVMTEIGLTERAVSKIHKRNLSQSKNLNVSQQAVRDYYNVKGLLADKDKDTSTKIAFVINNK